MPSRTLTLNEQLALLQDPAPKDFDPEAIDQDDSDRAADSADDSSVDSDAEDEAKLARAHYVTVGKSKLRKPEEVALGPKYEGARVSRGDLNAEGESESEDEEEKEDEELGGAELLSDDHQIPSDEDDDIDSDGALGSDEERFSGYKFKGSATTPNGVVPKRGERVTGESEEEEEEESESENEDQSGLSSEGEDEDERSEEDKDDACRREKLAKLMAKEEQAVTASASAAAQSDAEKGAAVRQQQKLFGSLLKVRIRMQKALVAVNSLPPSPSTTTPDDETSETWKGAESAALKLWNTLSSLRSGLSEARDGHSKKRKHEEIDENTDLDEVWTKMQKLEADATPWREAMLERWARKTQGATTAPLTRLNNTKPQTLTASIKSNLTSNRSRLLASTRIFRSGTGAQDVVENPEVYDDTDFYQQMLKTVIEQRMLEEEAGDAVKWSAAMKDSRKAGKKRVDTKASKGRKLKYHVHEKLQNFMAREENNSWEERQIDELFGSLLGQRLVVNEEDDEMEDEVVDDGLRIWG